VRAPLLAGLAVALALVVVVLALRVAARRRRDEIRSVHHYHDRLDTLHVEPHDRGGSVRVVEEVVEPEPHDPPSRPRLDEDAAQLAPWSPPPKPRERHHRHDERWALQRMETRARVDTGTILVVAIVVAVLVAIALAGYLVERRSTVTTTTSSSGSTSTTTTTTTPGTTTTTTLPTSLVARSSTSTLATYSVPARRYVVNVSAAGGSAWLSVTVPPLSNNVRTDTLSAGGVAHLRVTGPSDLVLGAPGNVAVSVGAIPVVFPAGYAAPLTLRFEPPA
jgi:hypothetical protein